MARQKRQAIDHLTLALDIEDAKHLGDGAAIGCGFEGGPWAAVRHETNTWKGRTRAIASAKARSAGNGEGDVLRGARSRDLNRRRNTFAGSELQDACSCGEGRCDQGSWSASPSIRREGRAVELRRANLSIARSKSMEDF